MTRKSGLASAVHTGINTENEDKPENETQKLRKSMQILKLLKSGVKM